MIVFGGANDWNLPEVGYWTVDTLAAEGNDCAFLLVARGPSERCSGIGF